MTVKQKQKPAQAFNIHRLKKHSNTECPVTNLPNLPYATHVSQYGGTMIHPDILTTTSNNVTCLL